MATKKSRAQKKSFIFGSFILCCLGASLLASAMATMNWFEATCHTDQATSTGTINFGLFQGQRTLTDGSTATHDLKATPRSGQAEFMDYGLWAGTIACLCLGMLFAVVGALFAVINTATTPVEAITGVPGLYVWNTLAALFNLVCVICWAVQFHAHLTKNVLLYDKDNGWTTEGNEVFGYSFWLVVVAIFVHVANILIIFFGTYEPKVKEQMKAPESKSGTIMLY